MRSHTLSAHDLQITKYKEIHGQFDILQVVWHECHICGKLVLMDGDALGGHIKGTHKMKEKVYKEQYCVYKQSRPKGPAPPPKKHKSSAKEEGSKKVTKEEKMKEVFKGEVKERAKGEKTKKEIKLSKVKVKNKGGSPENDTVCEAKHSDGKAFKSYQCKWCKKGYKGRNRLADHEKLPRKYACSKWHESNRHQREQTLKEEKTGFHCTICEARFSDLPEFRVHQAEGHSKKCHVSECNAKFGTKVELQRHVVSEHGVVDSTEMDKDVAAHLTTTRSQENIDIANLANDWISNPKVVEHMVRVMKGSRKSSRHTLFLDGRERLRCSGSDTSRLYQLSNPGFLGGGGQVDTDVVKQLEKIFVEHLSKAQTELKHIYESNNQMAFVYASCVLFPETFIHQHQLKGKNREEAEVAFMEVAVDAEEKKVLNKEIQDEARRRMEEGAMDSGDEWVDHSDLEESDE